LGRAQPRERHNTTPIAYWVPQLAAVRFGWEQGNGSVAFDDVAFGYARIVCQ
jgi:hypothetical protein